MTSTDIHQHLWTEPLLRALGERDELPFVREDNGLRILFSADERPYVIDTRPETAARRAALLSLDGLDRALLCLSSPLGIESLARAQARPLIDAYLDGALALGEPFGVWGAIALDGPDPDDVDDVLDRGCVGLSLPAGALAGSDSTACLRAVLERLQSRGAPLLVHPGPGAATTPPGELSLREPLWWPALTRYVAQMHAAWLAFVSGGRAEHPGLRVIFSMLAGLAPLHSERLRSRGGPNPCLADPLIFYETSSHGPSAVSALVSVIEPSQLLFGSDRPLVEPAELDMPDALDAAAIAEATARAFGHAVAAGAP